MPRQDDDPSEDDERPVLTIDLGAIVDNWRLLAARARPAEAAAAVKADAYGLGMARVAPALAAAGARTFFVATAAEGKALRALLPGPDIGLRGGARMREVRDAGFEVGLHVHDHIRWQRGRAPPGR